MKIVCGYSFRGGGGLHCGIEWGGGYKYTESMGGVYETLKLWGGGGRGEENIETIGGGGYENIETIGGGGG